MRPCLTGEFEGGNCKKGGAAAAWPCTPLCGRDGQRPLGTEISQRHRSTQRGTEEINTCSFNLAKMARSLHHIGGAGHMPYLYLHLREGEDLVEDLQGANYCDLAAAELAALTGLWDIAGESIKSGQPIKSSAIVIVD